MAWLSIVLRSPSRQVRLKTILLWGLSNLRNILQEILPNKVQTLSAIRIIISLPSTESATAFVPSSVFEALGHLMNS